LRLPAYDCRLAIADLRCSTASRSLVDCRGTLALTG
jgi:hypothetical protein